MIHNNQCVTSVYKSKDDDNEIQISFAINGILSPKHEQAFARSGQIKRLRIIEELQNQKDSPDILAQKILSENIVEQVNNTEILTREITTYQNKITKSSVKNTDEDKQQQLELEKRIKELEEQLEKGKSKILPMYEHRPLLEKSLIETKKEFLIISPWIRAKATNENFLEKLEKLLLKKVNVYIGYGLGNDHDKREYDEKAEQKVQNLAKKYPNFYLKRLGDTHAKILISDNNYAVVTSFNWLSFKGDSNLKFRDERGTIVFDSEEIKKLFDDYKNKLKSS